jgi:hypothetical protein
MTDIMPTPASLERARAIKSADFDPLPQAAKMIAGLPYGRMMVLAHGLRDRGIIIADIPEALLAQAIAAAIHDWAEAQRED